MKKIILASIIVLLSGCSKSALQDSSVMSKKPALLNTKQRDYQIKMVDKQIVAGAALNNGDKVYKQVESFDEYGNLIYQDYMISSVNTQNQASIDSYYIQYSVESQHTIGSKYYDYRRQLISTEKYNYQDNRLSVVYKYLDDKPDLITTYSYDEAGNMIHKSQKFADGRVFKDLVYKYNPQHQVIEETSKTLFSSIDKKITYTYNTNGDVIKEEIFYPRRDEHVINTFQYQYDKNNNWQERISFINGKAVVITQRVNNYR